MPLNPINVSFLTVPTLVAPSLKLSQIRQYQTATLTILTKKKKRQQKNDTEKNTKIKTKRFSLAK